METEDWFLNELDELLVASTDYRDKALFIAIKELTAEQDTRLEQLAGQLDGQLWSPREW